VEFCRALVVDDHLINQELLSFVLEEEGFEVRTAPCAEEALALAEQFKPDVLILDVQLPGMSGLDLTQQLRNRPAYRQTCIVIVTSYAMECDRERAFEAGCDGYITKPINTRTFAAEVLGFMKERAKAVTV
jgi:two-component system, cell cycle response regulator DivK